MMGSKKSYKRKKNSVRRQEKKEKERHQLEQLKSVRRKGQERGTAVY